MEITLSVSYINISLLENGFGDASLILRKEIIYLVINVNCLLSITRKYI